MGKSRIHGKGIFAAQPIPTGRRIIQYIGERIPKIESAERLAQGNAYIFAFNDRYDIDGKTLKNRARYINYSCDPNCAADKINGRLWIITIRDITAGEELTSDYGYELDGYKQRPCHCGARNCCGYILDQEYWGLIKRQAH